MVAIATIVGMRRTLTTAISQRRSRIGLPLADLRFRGQRWTATSIDEYGVVALISLNGSVTTTAHADAIDVIGWPAVQPREMVKVSRFNGPADIEIDARKAIKLRKLFRDARRNGDLLM